MSESAAAYEDIAREACRRWADVDRRLKDVTCGLVAYHEAGHAVACYALLVQPEWIWAGADGGTVSPGMRVAVAAALGKPPRWLTNRLVVQSLAGRVAEAVVTGSIQYYSNGKGGDDRYMEARAMDAIAPGFAKTREGRHYRDRLRRATRAFVRTWWPEIDALARALWSRAVADEDFIAGMPGREAAAIIRAVRSRRPAPMPSDAPESLHWPSSEEMVQQAMQAQQQAAASN